MPVIHQYKEEPAIDAQVGEKRRQEIRKLADGASHDLLAPLRTISGFAKLLQDENHDDLNESANEYINQIISGAGRMRQLVMDLLEYSRVESEIQADRPVRLNDVFDSVVGLLSTEIQNANALVTRDELPTVNANVVEMNLIFRNLITNSLEYRSAADVRIHVNATLAENKWTIAIHDNGIGIERNYHQQIFEMFRRLHSYSRYPGTGIGLAVCRRILQKLGGDIWVESELDRGSRFIFTIPDFDLSEKFTVLSASPVIPAPHLSSIRFAAMNVRVSRNGRQ